ncbi:ATPase 4, plasma membrane-type [Vanrija pseudolonga]|uniref:ATPase 4, plasma membrane-type n=1 Tax=Vanrija pseudolonga TaxID=143232 RepID=A0AAF0YEE0_9TREE|nr:ATPase 4, plasma membrane-type [Vanrija pseudolonga]
MSENEKHTPEEVPVKESSLPAPAQAAAAAEPEKKKREYKEMEEKHEGDQHARVALNEISFTAADLYDKDKVDIEHVVMEEVFQLLQCDDKGLTEAEATNRIGIFGPNKLQEKKENVFLQFLSFMWNPLSWVMEGAAIVAIALSNGGGKPPDWPDFVGIVLLLLVNSTIGFTTEVEDRLEADVEEFARRGLRALAVAYEDVLGDQPDSPGNGFELVGLLSIFDPPRSDTKQTIDDAMALGVKVKMVTGDQLAIAKETGRRLGLGDHMYAAKVLKDGPEPGSKHANLDEMIMDADGFAGVFPEHKFEIVKRIQALGHLCAMTGDGANDAPALSRANVGIAVEGATDAARGAADIVLTEPGLSTIVHAIYGSRVIFQRMRNYAIYACAVTIRIVVGFALMAFIWQFNFPPFMVLIIAVLNDGTIMTLSLDRVLPSTTPDEWNLIEVFTYGIGYGLYLAVSTIALYAIMQETTFFEDKFKVDRAADDNYTSHMVIYLQVAIISQALIFVTRSHGPSWTERPSVALMLAFCLAQLIASIIAAFGNWGFTKVHGISGGWIGIVWIWNIIWYIPLDLLKFIMKKTVIAAIQRRRAAQHAPALVDEHGERLQRTASRHESLYSNRTSFIGKARNKLRGGGAKISKNELQRFGSIQAQQSGAALQRAASRH